jgi:hypothetical protein
MSDKDFYLKKLRSADEKLPGDCRIEENQLQALKNLAHATSSMLEVLEELTGVGEPNK